MRVLMFHDCAFVGKELGEYLKSNKGFDVSFLSYPMQTKVSVPFMAQKLRKYCDKETLVHVHYCRYPAYVAMLSRKPYIIHCHGTDVRYGLNWWQKQALKKSKKNIISVLDIHTYIQNPIYLPRPINTQKFYSTKAHEGNKVLYIKKSYEDQSEKLARFCKEFGFDLTIKQHMAIPYEEMPRFLNEFDIFVDQRVFFPEPSKTGLEAIACGLAVVTPCDDLETTLESFKDLDKREKMVTLQNSKFMTKHALDEVANQLLQIYEKVFANL